MTGRPLGRRAFLGSTLALAACGKAAQSQPAPGPTRSLKCAPFPVGASVMTGQLRDPVFTGILDRHISQLTPEWEMKMEYILKPDGRLKFDAPDQIADYARAHAMRLHGHTLIWYAQDGEAFQKLKGPNGTGPADRPSMFDDAGAPKPALDALTRVLLG